MRKNTLIIRALVAFVLLAGGILIGMQIQYYIKQESDTEFEREISAPDEVQQEFERIHERQRIEDSIFRAEHPEFDTYRKYDPEDEDTWHLKPRTRIKPMQPIEAPAHETR